MTDKPKVKKGEEPVEETPVKVRAANEPLPINQADYRQKVRKVGPVPARKHAQLDQIDEALNMIAKGSEDVVEDEAGNLVEICGLTTNERLLTSVCATLAQLLREEWTYGAVRK